MTRKSETTSIAPPPPAVETPPERFDRVLSRAEFKPLKAVIDHLGLDSAVMNAAIVATNSYQMFLRNVGYNVVVLKHIHENDCYTRLGREGGIRAVVPLHDPTTWSTMVTLVNFDSTVSTTAKSVDFYDLQLAQFKTQLMSKSGNAA